MAKIRQKMQESLDRRRLEQDKILKKVASFNDEIAKQTDWNPYTFDSSRIETHKIKKVSDHQIKFIPTIKLVFICLLLISTGVIAVLYGLQKVVLVWGEGLSGDGGKQTMIAILMGAIFSVSGIFFYRKVGLGQTVSFDNAKGLIIKGSPARNDQKNLIKIGDVHAIQLLKKYNTGGGGAYQPTRNPAHCNSYEINLVLKDAGRLNVMDHGNIESIRQSAEILSHFLSRPVWSVLD